MKKSLHDASCLSSFKLPFKSSGTSPHSCNGFSLFEFLPCSRCFFLEFEDVVVFVFGLTADFWSYSTKSSVCCTPFFDPNFFLLDLNLLPFCHWLSSYDFLCAEAAFSLKF